MSEQERVKEMFEESGIPRYQWFTAIGYYRLFGQSRFFFAAICEFISAILAIVLFTHFILGMYHGIEGLSTKRIFGLLAFASGAYSGKNLFLGNLPLAAKSACFSFFIFYAWTAWMP